ncbi:MAG: hypothetical protein R6U25_10510 [Alkalispirochaeta sp.]
MEAGKIWAVACLSLTGILNALPVAAQSSPTHAGLDQALISREILLQSNHEGVLLQRVTADVAGTRWLWRAEGSLLLYEEIPVAGGYIEERRRLGSPVEDLTHTVGCEVGALSLGPISLSGIYHRLLDPTAGGTEWAALTDRDAIRLDRRLEPGRWTGVGFGGALPFSFLRARVAPGIVWITDDDTDVAGAACSVSWPSIAVTWSAARGAFSVRDDDSWLYDAPPFRADGVTQLGSTVVVRPSGADGTVELAAEGWQQRVGYRPLRHSAQTFGRALGRRLAVTARVSRTQSGFHAVTGGRPRSAEYTGIALFEGHQVRPWIWRIAWNRRSRWDDDLPRPAVDTYEGVLGLAWTRGVARLLRLRGTTDSRGTRGLHYRLRVAVGPAGLAASARHIWHHPSGDDGFSATCRLSVRTALGRHGRRFSARAGWDVEEEESEWHHGVAMNASIPLGRSFRIELSGKLPLTPMASIDTTEWLLRLRNSATTQVSGAPPESRS